MMSKEYILGYTLDEQGNYYNNINQALSIQNVFWQIALGLGHTLHKLYIEGYRLIQKCIQYDCKY